MNPSTDEIQYVLECALGRIERIERKVSPYRSSYEVEELHITLADGAALDIIFKDLSPEAVLKKARVKPNSLYNPLRELETYQRLLNVRPLDTAKCYATVAEEGRYWLFLEHVGATHLWEVGDLEIWRNAARWLRSLHQEAPALPQLIRYDRCYYEDCWGRAARLHPELQAVEPAYARAVDVLADFPSVFIHGEFYASNVLVQGERICVVDWEMSGLGPGLLDLAALSAGEWRPDQRRDFARAYLGEDPPPEMMNALDCCQMHLAVRLLGWAEGWKPPAQHARNWLSEALQLGSVL